jgi:hypothetical protein
MMNMATGNPDTSKWNGKFGDDDYRWEDENEDRLWYCAHGKAYAIRCKRCEEEDE